MGATVQIATMGSLASELLRAGFQPIGVNFLTVEGKKDEADLTLIRDYMPNLVSIDMTTSNATAIHDTTNWLKLNLGFLISSRALINALMHRSSMRCN